MTTIVFDFSFVLKALFIPWLWQETTMNLDVYSVCNISSNSSALFFKAAPVRPAFYSSPFSCCCCMFSGFRDSVWNVWLIKFSFKPYKSCQFLSNPVKICQILFNPVKYYWILSNPVKCYQIFSFFFVVLYSDFCNVFLIANFSFKPFQSCWVLSKPVKSFQILLNPVKSFNLPSLRSLTGQFLLSCSYQSLVKMGWLLSPSFITIWQKIWIFY